MILTISIKPQMPDNQTTQNLLTSSESVGLALRWIFISSIILNVLLSSKSTIDYYVAMINCLQMIVHIPLLKIVIPANLSYFTSLLLPFVMFDLVEGI